MKASQKIKATLKKSQDGSQSASSSAEVSTEPTSTTAQPQQPEVGGSDYTVDDGWDDVVDDLLPTNLNVQAASFEGVQTVYNEESIRGAQA